MTTASAVAVAALAAIAVPAAFATPTAPIPAMAGMVEQDALKAAEAAGFTVQVETDFSDTVPQGEVASTDPEGGVVMEEGATIVLRVSDGPRMVTVPDFAEVARVDAPAAVVDGEPLVEVNEEWSDTLPAETFISQDPAAGTTVRHDATVTVVYSLGPIPVEIPNVKGKSKSAAVKTLEAVGLVVKVKKKTSESVAKGKVIKQSPKGGEDGHRTDTVTIWVSKGKAPTASSSGGGLDYVTAMVALRGKTASQAKAYAKANGIDLEIVYSDTGGHGTPGKVLLSTCYSSSPMKCEVIIHI